MHDIGATLRLLHVKLHGMWAHRRLGLAVAWFVGIGGIALLLSMPTRYEATARIFVNTDSILKPLMVGLTVHPNEEQRIVMLSRVVISRPNVEKLVEAVKLDRDARSPEERERVIDGVMKTLEFKGSGRDNLYTLSFRDVDPARAKNAIEMLAQMFIDSSRGGRDEDTQVAKGFIDDQVAQYDAKLQEAENRLKEFRLRYLGMTPGDGKDYFMRMSETEKLLAQARLELREAERARDAFRQGLANQGTPGAGGVDPAQVAEMDRRVEDTRRSLDGLLLRYTDSHPDVIAARRVLRELEEQRRQMVASGVRMNPGYAPATITGPSAAETIKVSLAQSEAAVASLTTRVAEYSERYNKLRAAAAMVPQLEAEYAQLNRDYDVNKKNYESLVARRESAAMSGEMQSVAGVSDFRLVDPPRVSPRPVSPKTSILLPMLFVASLLAGLAAAYVASEARPTFHDTHELRGAIDLPVVGTVTRIFNQNERRIARARAIRYAGAMAALVAVFALTFVSIELLAVRVI